jgi:membrane-associated phospholipid phosphatase
VQLRPLEGLNLATLALLSLLTAGLAAAGRVSRPGPILLRFAVMAAGVALVAWLAKRFARLPGPVRFVVDFYPIAFVPLLYESLGPLIAASGRSRDSWLIAADRALFGVDVTVWLQRAVRPFWNDFFAVAYITYYFIAIALGVALWIGPEKQTARRFIFTLTVCYLVSYAGYFLVPALGPRSALPHQVPIADTPVAGAISETLNELEHTKYDVFPSGHTMIAVTVLVVAFQRARKMFWLLLPIATCLILSTVYCRYHYVVDLIAGAILAIVTIPLADRWYDRWRRSEL